MGNKTIIIIGGLGLLGKEIVKHFSLKNFNIVVIDNRTLSKQIPEYFKKVSFYNSDITKINLIKKTFEKIKKKFKRIDVIINCSYPKNNNYGAKFEKLKQKDLKENLFLQLGTAILIAQISLKIFLKQKFGNFIMVSSIQGISSPKFEHYKNTKMSSPIEYTASKSGIISITKYLAKYYKNRNIRINCISPGGIKDKQPKKFIKKYREACLSKGLLNPGDIVGTIEFLISKESSYINGQNIVIDDGWSL